MAKKKNVEAAETAAVEPKTTQVKVFRAGRALEDDDKLSPQAKAIVAFFQDNADREFTRKALIEALEADGRLVTKQPITNIFNFYQKTLVDKGLVLDELVSKAA